MALHQSGEDYLEAILALRQQKGTVRSIDVVQYLGYSKPSISRAMSILRSSGYITMEKDGRLELTQAGEAVAQSIYERHRFLTQWLIRLGVSQISGASRTSVGGYTEKIRPHDSEQFDVSDQRSLDEVVDWLMKMGFIPSFCTACYREGRTGDRFMSLCKSGQILNCRHPNALMTLTEYLVDYASEETKQTGYALIERELAKITNEKVKALATQHIADIKASNRRDFRF